MCCSANNIVHDFLQKKAQMQKEFADKLGDLISGSRKQLKDLLDKKKYSRDTNQLVELYEILLLYAKLLFHL